jgi:DNA-binding response OmpR family regulator
VRPEMDRSVSAAGFRVVVADDDADIRALVAISVRKAGHELVETLPDGDAAWESIQEHRPDLAVLDVSMPGMTGLEVCRRIRADASVGGMQIVLLSAAVDEGSRQAGLDAGADEYLIKPFSPRELVERLSSLAPRMGAGV